MDPRFAFLLAQCVYSAGLWDVVLSSLVTTIRVPYWIAHGRCPFERVESKACPRHLVSVLNGPRDFESLLFKEESAASQCLSHAAVEGFVLMSPPAYRPIGNTKGRPYAGQQRTFNYGIADFFRDPGVKLVEPGHSWGLSRSQSNYFGIAGPTNAPFAV